jgi:hypothetical protein
MFSGIRRYFIERKIRKLISQATNIIYSEPSDLIEAIERNLTSKQKPFDLLCAYIAIRIAADAKSEIKKADIDYALQELCSQRLSFNNQEEYKAVIGRLKSDTQISLLRTAMNLLISRTAYEADEYSLDGMIYRAAKAKKGPLSHEERNKICALASELMQVRKQIEEHKKLTCSVQVPVSNIELKENQRG